MNLKNRIKSSKSKLTKRIAVIAATASTMVMTSATQFYAAVDLSGGVEQVTNSVISQGKAIAATIFAAVAVVALIFTIVRGVKAGIAYRENKPFEVGSIIGGGIATIVCGLCSSAAFFGWFGL